MVEEVLYFLPPFIAFSLVAIGFAYRESIAGITGGVLLFLFGLNMVFNPLPVLSDFSNIVLATITWGYGAYLLIRGSWESGLGDMFGG